MQLQPLKDAGDKHLFGTLSRYTNIELEYKVQTQKGSAAGNRKGRDIIVKLNGFYTQVPAINGISHYFHSTQTSVVSTPL